MAEYVCWVADGPTEPGMARRSLRERVTRCRDCEHAHQSPIADSEKLMCERFDEMFVSPGGFCAWGESREEE